MKAKKRIIRKWWHLFGTPCDNEGYYLNRLHEKRGLLRVDAFITKYCDARM